MILDISVIVFIHSFIHSNINQSYVSMGVVLNREQKHFIFSYEYIFFNPINTLRTLILFIERRNKWMDFIYFSLELVLTSN